MEWISVEDRLPEVSDFGEHVQGYCDGQWTKVYLGEVSFLGEDEWIIFNELKDIFKVTHWMPLPEPPQ